MLTLKLGSVFCSNGVREATTANSSVFRIEDVSPKGDPGVAVAGTAFRFDFSFSFDSASASACPAEGISTVDTSSLISSF
jgi:hypothetical protein